MLKICILKKFDYLENPKSEHLTLCPQPTLARAQYAPSSGVIIDNFGRASMALCPKYKKSPVWGLEVRKACKGDGSGHHRQKPHSLSPVLPCIGFPILILWVRCSLW